MKQIIQFWRACGIALCGLLATSPAQAQIASDRTLSTNVKTTDNRNFSITDGNRAGKNLFHSFSEFSVPTGGSAFFNNAPDIQNIISRVTGSSISNIDGLIRANGAANLFLLNPNGIIFGRNALLSIGGSFLGSTASSLNFADGTKFSATAPQTTPLLTISVPIGLQFGGNPGRIGVQGDGQGLRSGTELIDTTVGLHVESNQTLALVGGDVALEGATLKTAGGRIELGSVAGPSLVSLTPIDKGWSLGYSGVQNFRDIQLSGTAAVDASGLGGGDIQVQGRQVMLKDGSQIEASTLGSEAGGTLAVTASESVNLSGTAANSDYVSSLAVRVYGGVTGAGGKLTLKTGRLIVRDGAEVTTSTLGPGQGGALYVNASDSVELLGGSVLTGLFARTSSAGAAGELRIATGKLLVQDGARVSTSTRGEGQAGALSVSASDSVELIGGSDQGRSGLFAATSGAGGAGELRIATGKLLVQDGAGVFASTSGQGNGGSIQVNATNSVNLSGVSPSGLSSGLFTSTSGVGQGGTITVNSNTFRLADGAVVSALTTAEGKGGNITVNANTFEADNGGQVLTTTSSSGHAGDIKLNVPNSVTLSDSDRSFTAQLAGFGQDVFINEGSVVSGLFANTDTNSTGNGGSISIDPIKLTLTDGASVAVNSRGKGNAGNLLIQAGSVTLDRGASLLAATASGEGGKLTLNAQDLLLMRHNSQISAEAQGTANGGNITINTPSLVAVPSENSDIIATAMNGNGGNIGITARGVFGIQPNNLDTSQSYISASSQLGINGTVQINTLDINRTQALVPLPVVPVDASRLIAQGCPAYAQPQVKKIAVTPSPGFILSPRATNGNTGFDRMDAAIDPIAALAEPSTFVVSGRGGIPPSPTQPLSSDAVMTNWATLNPKVKNHSREAYSSNPTNKAPTQIVEAQGWIIGPKGEVILTAQAPTVTPDIPWLKPTTCHAQ